MKSVEMRFMEKITTLDSLTLPSGSKVISGILITFISITIAILQLTPWIQTAQGSGEVSTLDPKNRTQAISALVGGQIKTWHVKEGDYVKAGDPIVTLIDRDKALVENLQTQLEATKQRHQANLSAVANGQKNLERQKALLAQGLVSARDVEMVEIRLQDLQAKAAKTVAEVSEISVSLARQSTLTKVAPQNGRMLRLLAAGNSTYVKAGDVLAQFLPDSEEREVMIKVNGLDAPLVHAGRKVRLQFEGWPVLQFSGWPETAVGTFGGIVEFIEPVADINGQFNVWIKEDKTEDPWPNNNYIRIGSRVKGWILLEEVKLGYEMWRQLNNFPPIPPLQNGNGNGKGAK